MARDQEELRRIVEAINSFENARIGLGGLVNRLEALLNVLQFVTPSWKQTYLGYWGSLEDTHAAMRDQGLSSGSAIDMSSVNNAVAKIKLMALNEIDEQI